MNQLMKIHTTFFLTCFLLTGCLQFSPDRPHTLRATRKSHEIALDYSSVQTRLSEEQKKHLLQAKALCTDKTPIYAEIRLPLENTPGRQRLTYLQDYLIKLGILRQNIKVLDDDTLPSASHAITVSLIQYEASVPLCSGWTEPMSDVFGQGAGPHGEVNFKCATEKNLARMLAEPKDLIEPRQLGKADGKYLVKTIENLQNINVSDANNKGDKASANSGIK